MARANKVQPAIKDDEIDLEALEHVAGGAGVPTLGKDALDWANHGMIAHVDPSPVHAAPAPAAHSEPGHVAAALSHGVGPAVEAHQGAIGGINEYQSHHAAPIPATAFGPAPGGDTGIVGPGHTPAPAGGHDASGGHGIVPPGGTSAVHDTPAHAAAPSAGHLDPSQMAAAVPHSALHISEVGAQIAAATGQPSHAATEVPGHLGLGGHSGPTTDVPSHAAPAPTTGFHPAPGGDTGIVGPGHTPAPAGGYDASGGHGIVPPGGTSVVHEVQQVHHAATTPVVNDHVGASTGVSTTVNGAHGTSVTAEVHAGGDASVKVTATSVDAHAGAGAGASVTTQLGHGASVTMEVHATGDAGAHAGPTGVTAHAGGGVGGSERIDTGVGVTATVSGDAHGDVHAKLDRTGVGAGATGDAQVTVGLHQDRGGNVGNGTHMSETVDAKVGMYANANADVHAGSYKGEDGKTHYGVTDKVGAMTGDSATVEVHGKVGGHGVEGDLGVSASSPGQVGLKMGGGADYSNGTLHLGANASFGFVLAGVGVSAGLDIQTKPIVDMATTVGHAIIDHAPAAIHTVDTALHTGANAVTHTATDAFHSAADLADQAANRITGGFGLGGSVMGGAVHTATDAVASTASTVAHTVDSGAHTAANVVSSGLQTAGNDIKHGLETVGDTLGHAAKSY